MGMGPKAAANASCKATHTELTCTQRLSLLMICSGALCICTAVRCTGDMRQCPRMLCCAVLQDAAHSSVLTICCQYGMRGSSSEAALSPPWKLAEPPVHMTVTKFRSLQSPAVIHGLYKPSCTSTFPGHSRLLSTEKATVARAHFSSADLRAGAEGTLFSLGCALHRWTLQRWSATYEQGLRARRLPPQGGAVNMYHAAGRKHSARQRCHRPGWSKCAAGAKAAPGVAFPWSTAPFSRATSCAVHSQDCNNERVQVSLQSSTICKVHDRMHSCRMPQPKA